MSDVTPLLTIRDFLRWAISRFNAAGLVYGHGTSDALDDAAYLILEGLHLPIDRLDPFLDARLLPEERARLTALIEARATTRRPTAYLLNRAYVGAAPFFVDERAIVPRSYIGELLRNEALVGGERSLIADAGAIKTALDLCTGSGCLALLMAQAFPQARIDAVDVSRAALEVARRNVGDYRAEDRVRLYEGDLFAPLGDKRYDLIVTNPPYVSDAVMRDLPPEFRSEPALALAGGGDGFDVARRILAEAPRHLTRDGALICEIGEDRDILEAEFPDLPFLWLDTQESAGEVFFLAAEAFGVRRPPRAPAGTAPRPRPARAKDAAAASTSAARRPRRR